MLWMDIPKCHLKTGAWNSNMQIVFLGGSNAKIGERMNEVIEKE